MGPSGGYSLEDSFLESFGSLSAIDPDPLAPWMFRRAHPRLSVSKKIHWLRQSPLNPEAPLEEQSADLRDFLSACPPGAVLFCNVLGQMPTVFPGISDRPRQDFTAWKNTLQSSLATRHWASYHDRLSGPVSPTPPVASPTTLSTQDLAARAWGHASTPKIELVDHQMEGLLEGRPRAYFIWSITPVQHHLIEAVSSGE